MASSSSSNQRPAPPKGTRSRKNTIQQPPPHNKENVAFEDVVMTRRLSPQHSQTGSKQINQYEFRHTLGRGQHGEVFVAYDQRKHREVAIKAVKRKNPKIDRMYQFRKKNLPRSPHTPVTDSLGTTEYKIRKEIAIMKKCRHPHVVRLLEVIDDHFFEKIYMVMEYLAGGEIKWRTPNEEPALRVDQTRRICRDVILGLEYLHHQGIIHRDIKPANLLWTADRRMVKIADFGVSHFSYAQHLLSTGEDGKQTNIRDPILMDESDLSKFAGTPFFLAPEIVSDSPSESTAADLDQLATATTTGTSTTMTKKKQPITKAIDIWAFGVTLYGLLFGKLPFTAENEYQIYSVIRDEDWDVPETMGCDHLPVGGRRQEAPLPGQETEGYLVVSLLQKLLEKDARKRITLDEVKRHPWIIRDMSSPDDWLRYARVGDSLSPTEQETRSAVSDVRFRWNNTFLIKLVKKVRPSRRGSSSRKQRGADDKVYKDVGVRSEPQTLARHKSTAVTAAEKGKQVVSQQHHTQPRRVSPRTETSSSTSMKSSQTKISTIEPWAMWGSGSSNSGRKSRRDSSSGSSPLVIDGLTVPNRGPSRVGSPQPPTPNSAYGTSQNSSQIPSPVSDSSPSQRTPPERPTSRFSLIPLIPRWLRIPTQGGSSATSTYSRGPSPMEASTSSLVPTSATLAPSFSAVAASGSIAPSSSKQITVRRSEDAFHHTRGRQSISSNGEPYSLGLRAASWGEVRESADLTSLYSGERADEALDQDTMLLGAGGVAQSPVSSLPTGSGVLSTVSSTISLGPPAFSAAQALIRTRTDPTSELPSSADSAAHDPHRRSHYRASHHATTSPLSRPSYSRRETHRSYDSDDAFSGGERTPSELDYHHANLHRSTSQMYREEDEASSDSEGGEKPLEVRTRRPSAGVDASSGPRPPSPPRRNPSQQSERTMVCT